MRQLLKTFTLVLLIGCVAVLLHFGPNSNGNPWQGFLCMVMCFCILFFFFYTLGAFDTKQP